MKHLIKILPNNKKDIIKLLVPAIFIVLFLFRVFELDRDLPNFGIGLYQAKDEGHYSEMSLLYNKYGSFTGPSEYPIDINSYFRTNIIGNALQIVSLKLLGNNYYGFRIVYTVFSLLTVLLLCGILNRLAEYYGVSDKFKNRIKIILLAFLLVFFPFLLMGRVVENTGLRTFSTCLFIYLCCKKGISNKVKYFCLTFCGVISWALIYFSNIHLLIACAVLFLSILFSGWNRENRLKLLYMIGGGIVGLILAEIYYFTVWGSGLFHNFFDSISSFSTRVVITGDEGGILRKIFHGFLTFVGSNMFLYFISLVVLAVMSILLNIYIYKKERNEANLCNITIVCAVFLQSLFVNDWNERKVIVILPSILISILISIFWIKKNGFSPKSMKLRYKLIVLILAVGAGGFAFVAGYKYRGLQKHLVDFQRIDLEIIKLSGIIQVLLASILSVTIFFKTISLRVQKSILVILGIVVFSTNIFFDVKYVYLYDKYTEKQVMIDIGKDLGDAYVLGPYVYGYCLYNDIKPLGLYPEHAKNDDVNYFLDYKNGPYYAHYSGLEKTFLLEKKYYRGLKAIGKYYPIGIFKKTEAN